jgi:pimeloyl-ACP methyl ester carboxylesterase
MKSRLFLLTFLLVSCSCLNAQVGIDRDEIITIGGIKQFIHIEGKDNTKPLLLFLHGGPGGSVMSYADKFTKKLQDHFIVVQWDQRETGRTKQLNVSPLPLTVSLFQNDIHELIDSLLKKFNQSKLYLVGYSWGTYLGFQMAKMYPELLHAYIAVSPMIHQAESERIILDRMKEKARLSGNKKGMEELQTIKVPFENGEQLYYHRKWLFEYVGSSTRASRNYVLGWATTWLTLFNEASRENLFEDLPQIGCPVYFCAGRKDFQTNFTLTEAYYKKLMAPKKDLFWFEKSAHLIPSTEPEFLQQVIIEKVLPETSGAKIK